MGLFQNSKQTKKSTHSENAVLDDALREELRNHGRWYFEKVINASGAQFKKDLDATITQVNIDIKRYVTTQLDSAVAQLNTDLKEHVTKRLDEQFKEYAKLMKGAQDVALESLTQNSHALQSQYQDLRKTLEAHIASQQTELKTVMAENKARSTELDEAQKTALETLSKSTAALQTMHDELRESVKQDIAAQQQALIDSFQANMAQVVEQYLLEALGDQYDLKAQLPAIMNQMEANKQAIADDMKL